MLHRGRVHVPFILQVRKRHGNSKESIKSAPRKEARRMGWIVCEVGWSQHDDCKAFNIVGRAPLLCAKFLQLHAIGVVCIKN